MQMHLGEVFPVPESVSEERQVVPAHTRRVAKTDLAHAEESVPFFDESRVPVEIIMVIDAEIRESELPPGATPRQLCGAELRPPTAQAA